MTRKVWTDSEDAELTRLNSDGNSDREIARLMEWNRGTVNENHRRLGLPDRSRGPQTRAALTAAAKRRVDGVEAANQGRVDHWLKMVRESGWPEHVNGRPISRRHVQILDALWKHGPQTRRQLAERIGMTGANKPSVFQTVGRQGSTYLSDLMYAGLVMHLGKMFAGEGKGHSMNIYALMLDVEKGVPRAE